MADSSHLQTESHAHKLLSTLQDQRRQGFVCDFTIKAGGEIFPVHRNVIAAFSGYFRMMFLHNTKEAQDGFIETKLDAEAVRQCLDYMYTGHASVTEKNVQPLLYASGLMQLDGLANLCFDYVKPKVTKETDTAQEKPTSEGRKSTASKEKDTNDRSHLGQIACASYSHSEVNNPKVTTCLNLRDSAQEKPTNEERKSDASKEKYTNDGSHLGQIACASQSHSEVNHPKVTTCPNLRDLARNCATKHFHRLVFSRVLPLVKVDDLRYLIQTSKIGYAVSWRAIMTWMNSEDSKARYLPNLFKITAKAKNFPFSFVMNVVWADPFMHSRHIFLQPVAANLLSDIDIFCKNINLLTFPILMKVVDSSASKRAQTAKESILGFIFNNLEKVLLNKDFIKDTNESELLGLFKRSAPGEATEKKKWHALMTWLEGRQCQKGVFVRFLDLINFNILTLDFIKETINTESEIVETGGETDTVLNVVCDYMHHKVEVATAVARSDIPYIVVAENSTGLIKQRNLKDNKWTCMAEAGKGEHLAVVSVHKILYVLNNDSLLQLQKDKSWMQMATMPHQLDVWIKVVSSGNSIFVLERDKLSCYDTSQNAWVEDLPTGGLDMGFCATASHQYIYAMGGITKGRSAKKYKIHSLQWIDMPMMKVARSDASATILRGSLYVLGGWWGNRALSSVEFFGLGGDTWTKFTSMNIPRHGFCACVMDGNLYAVGGDFYLDSEKQHTVEVHDGISQSWNVLQYLDINENPCRACAHVVQAE